MTTPVGQLDVLISDPITLEPMTNAVIAPCCGTSYDRVVIEREISIRHRCAMCRQALEVPQLIPNRALTDIVRLLDPTAENTFKNVFDSVMSGQIVTYSKQQLETTIQETSISRIKSYIRDRIKDGISEIDVQEKMIDKLDRKVSVGCIDRLSSAFGGIQLELSKAREVKKDEQLQKQNEQLQKKDDQIQAQQTEINTQQKELKQAYKQVIDSREESKNLISVHDKQIETYKKELNKSKEINFVCGGALAAGALALVGVAVAGGPIFGAVSVPLVAAAAPVGTSAATIASIAVAGEVMIVTGAGAVGANLAYPYLVEEPGEMEEVKPKPKVDEVD